MTNIQRIYTAHTIRFIATSIIGIYVPIYLLTLGYSLSEVIFYFITLHIAGIFLGLFLFVPLMRKKGLINTLKLYYPLQIIHLLMLLLLKNYPFPIGIIAIIGAAASYAYWMPLNILFVRFSEFSQMGSNLSKFFAFPKLFGIIGPLFAAILIPFVGFWPVFLIAGLILIFSYYPLLFIKDFNLTISLNFSKTIKTIKSRKTLFALEGIDNIIEDSEWFWAIYVFLIIGSLSAPGIVGSLEALGAALFTLLIGKYANKNAKKLIPIAAIILVFVYFFRFFIVDQVPAYIITVVASFVMTMFLVSYFATIYKSIKGEGEEEFIVLREIPTAIGKLIVLGTIYLTINDLRYFFLMPSLFIVLLLIVYFKKSKILAS